LGSGGIAPNINNLGTRGKWSASYPRHFTPMIKAPNTYWIRMLSGPPKLVRMWWGREKIHCCLYWELNPSCPVHNLVFILTELLWLLQ